MDMVNDDPSGQPIPDGMETVYTFPVNASGGIRSYVHPDYEKPVTLKSGKIAPGLVDVMRVYLAKKARDAGTPDQAEAIKKIAKELSLIVRICPPDALLADYRALLLRVYFERFLRAAVDSLVSPDGTSNAARVLTSDGGFRKDSFSELSRVMIAGLLSGTDSSIASSVRLYLESVS